MRLIRIYVINKNLYYYCYYYLLKQQRTKNLEQREWNRISYDCADALEHIHRCGFPHNHLKANKVVLKKHNDQVLHLAKTDFGKSSL